MVVWTEAEESAASGFSWKTGLAVLHGRSPALRRGVCVGECGGIGSIIPLIGLRMNGRHLRQTGYPRGSAYEICTCHRFFAVAPISILAGPVRGSPAD